MSEIKHSYDGIMAVITNPAVTDVLLIQELTRSERTGKDIGDFAFPAESRDHHEKDPFDTAARIFQEEIQVIGAEFRSLLCYLDINTLRVGVMHYIADRNREVSIGTAQNEVANPSWFSLQDMKSGSIKVRQGVKEVVDLLTGTSNRGEDIIKTVSRFPSNNRFSNPRSQNSLI